MVEPARLKNMRKSNWESFPQIGWKEHKTIRNHHPSGYLWPFSSPRITCDHTSKKRGVHTYFFGVHPETYQLPPLWQIPIGKSTNNRGYLCFFSIPKIPIPEHQRKKHEPGPGVGADSFPGTWVGIGVFLPKNHGVLSTNKVVRGGGKDGKL